jgi:heptosyltransferase-2
MTSFNAGRLVVRAPNWLGDVVLSLPAMGMVRAAYPEAELTIALPTPFAPLFEQQTPVGSVEVIAPDVLKAGAFEAMVLLTNSFGSAWRAMRAGIPERWGYAAAGRSWLLTRAVPRPSRRVHQADYYRALTRALGMPEGDDVPRISPGARTEERAATFLAGSALEGARLVGFGPGAAYGHAKRWPPKHVAEVIARLASEQGVTCLLFGGPGDLDAGREIESALGSRSLAPGQVLNLIGRTDLRLLIGLLARCETFVTNDSGSMHVAAALGTRVVAMFGPTDERETAPVGARSEVLTADVFCRPCMLRDCPIDHRCMKRITPERVLDAVGARAAGTA